MSHTSGEKCNEPAVPRMSLGGGTEKLPNYRMRPRKKAAAELADLQSGKASQAAGFEDTMMTTTGIVRGNQVILPEGVSLPDGTAVVVSAASAPAMAPPTTEERLAVLKRMFGMNLPVADWELMEQEIIQGATHCLP